MSRQPADSVQDLLERAIRAGSAPGLAAGWITSEDPAPTILATGRAVVAPSMAQATAETWFDLASLTKPLVVGTLTLFAIRDGVLALETTAGEILPEATASPIGQLSVRELLTHSSGLPAWEPIYVLTGGFPDRAIDALAGLTLAESGAHVVYSCPGFILLGMMLERLMGRRLDHLFEDRVVAPLGLHREIGFLPTSSLPLAGGARLPTTEQQLLKERGLEADLIPAIKPGRPDDGNSRFFGGVAGNAGLFGTVSGVLALARIYLGAGEFLRVGEITLATENHTRGLEQARGLGWQLASSPGCSAGPALDPSAFGHTGFTGTSLWVDPTRGIAMTLLANRVHPGHRPTDLHPLRRRFHQLVVDQLS